MVNTLETETRAEIIVAEQNGTIVGSVVLYPGETTFSLPDGSIYTLEAPELRLLAVLPSARGRGVGRALMEECLRRARVAGAKVSRFTPPK